MGYDQDPARCVILVPIGNYLEPDCERGLAALSARGYAVRRVYGYSAIDQARSQIATDALADGFDELMWIDSDIAFDPDAVDRLRRRLLPVCCGIYPKKNQRALAVHLLPETAAIRFGDGGGLLEVKYAATGFLHTRREVYEKMAVHEDLPVCNLRFGRATVPYFLPLLLPEVDGHWYLGEDFAFSERARRSGFTIMADTSIRLEHIGKYRFTWEEAGSSRDRFATYDYTIRNSSPVEREAPSATNPDGDTERVVSESRSGLLE